MSVYLRNLSALMPASFTLPEPLLNCFTWIEDQGGHHTRDGGAQPQDHWLSIYPPADLTNPAASMVAFGGTALPFTAAWTTPDPAIDARIFELAETSGDGARAALWRDDAGAQYFVHIGHDTLGVITDDPVVFLQFLAMGYPEPGALARTDITPLDAALEHHGLTDADDLAPDDHPLPPTAFQAYLETTFNVPLPATARALGIPDFTPYHAPDATDPFARWVADVTPPPSEADLVYERALMDTVEQLDLRDTDSSDIIMQKIGGLFGRTDP